MNKYRFQRGISLMELLFAVIALGILAVAMAPLMSGYVGSLRSTYTKKQEINNQSIGSALIQYGHDSTKLGQFPTPYTGGAFTSTIYNPADASVPGLALTGALTQSGINPSEVNDDNYPSHRVRVFQRVAGLTTAMPLYFQSGPLVTLTYQYGAVYMTACEQVKGTCNPGAGSVPGASPVMTSANYKTWTTVSPDLPPYFVTTLPLQKQMLANTALKMDKIRDSLLSYFRAQQNTASGNDTTNWWLPTTPTLGGQTPGANQGCRDGWYDLSTDPNILPGIGLTQTEYGTTAWGGSIQFCRDYDPTGTKSPNASPHYAAIRINNNISAGIAPDSSVTGNNLVLTF